MAVNATVNTPRTTRASLSQANTSQVVRVTVPGPKGDAGDFEEITLQQIGNVDSTNLVDGSVLQFSTTTNKFVAVNELHNSGNFTINGGNF